jgi:hypothetical protein
LVNEPELVLEERKIKFWDCRRLKIWVPLPARFRAPLPAADVTWAPGVTPKRDLRDLIDFNLENYQLEFQGGRCCRGLPAYGNYFQDIFEEAQVRQSKFQFFTNRGLSGILFLLSALHELQGENIGGS